MNIRKTETNSDSFDEYAYLSGQAEKNRQKIKKKYIEVFELSNQINKLANKIKYELSITENNQKQQIMCGLFIKIIKSFNSAIILFEYGLEQDAISISRIMLENVWKFAAIFNDDEFYDNYLLEDLYGLKALKNKVLKNPNKYEAGYLDKINEQIKNNGLHNTKKPKSYDSFEIAQIARMEDLHRYLYDRYSSYVHSDGKSIARCFYIEDEKIEFDILPKTIELEPVLAMNIHAFCRILYIWNDIFDLKHLQELENIGEKVNNIFADLNSRKQEA